MSLENLEKRIKVLEDIEEIQKLKRRYCALCDDHYDAHPRAELFTADPVGDGTERGGSMETPTLEESRVRGNPEMRAISGRNCRKNGTREDWLRI